MLCGIDYSINSPAICIHPINVTWSFENCEFFYLSSKKEGPYYVEEQVFVGKLSDATGIRKYAATANEIITYLKGCDVSVAAIEDYAYAGKGRVFHIGENAALLKWMLFMSNIKYTVVPPTVIKKYATTKGNATKDDMYSAFLLEGCPPIKDEISPRHTKIDSPVSDLVDAYYIAKWLHWNLPNADWK